MNDTYNILSRQSDRHAYLILCHNNFNVLCKLLSAIDDERNDIYIHIDKKTKQVPFPQIKDSICKSQLVFIKRLPVNWGDYSQIKAELALLNEATKSPHSYYHLISGVDFPLKTQNYIHTFFIKNMGKQFISVDYCEERRVEFTDRIRYYYPFQDIIGRNRGKFIAACEILQNSLLALQNRLHVDRTKSCPIQICKGSNWFSITHDFALYLLKQMPLIDKHFSKSLCADELFLQSIAYASPYKDSIVNSNMRLIDWHRGKPYTFLLSDYEQLITSDHLFARKFDENVDMDIVFKLFEHIQNSEQDFELKSSL